MSLKLTSNLYANPVGFIFPESDHFSLRPRPSLWSQLLYPQGRLGNGCWCLGGEPSRGRGTQLAQGSWAGRDTGEQAPKPHCLLASDLLPGPLTGRAQTEARGQVGHRCGPWLSTGRVEGGWVAGKKALAASLCTLSGALQVQSPALHSASGVWAKSGGHFHSCFK